MILFSRRCPGLLCSAVAIGVVTVAALWHGGRVSGQTASDGDRPSSFGMIGLARGQTARLNVVDIRAIPPDIGDRCGVELRFLDSRGAVLKTSRVSLAPGHAGFLDLARDAAPAPAQPGGVAPDTADRQQIRAVWVAPDIGDMPQCGRSNFIATLEVFDQDGKTSVLVSLEISFATGHL